MIYFANHFNLGWVDLRQHTSISITPIDERTALKYMTQPETTKITSSSDIILKSDDILIIDTYVKGIGPQDLKITISNAESLAKALSSSEEPLIAESTLGESILS